MPIVHVPDQPPESRPGTKEVGFPSTVHQTTSSVHRYHSNEVRPFHALPPQTSMPYLNVLPPQAFGLTSGKGGLVRLDCWTANSSFWSWHTPCPTSSDRRRPTASQYRRPRRARWSFPSYSPESLSRDSTHASRNRRQISSHVPPEGALVARQYENMFVVSGR